MQLVRVGFIELDNIHPLLNIFPSRLILLLGFNSCRKPQNGTQSQGLKLGLTLNGLNFKLPGLLT